MTANDSSSVPMLETLEPRLLLSTTQAFDLIIDAPELTVPASVITDEDTSAGVLPAIKVTDADLYEGSGFIAGGGGHSVGLRVDGTVAVWGAGSWGDGEHTPPPGLSDVVAVSANSEHSLALKSDGTVVAWGTSDFGLDTVPCDLGAVEAISAGYEYNLVLEKDGDVIAWGRDQYGERDDIPEDLCDVTAIAAGYTFGMALESDGTVRTWGGPGNAYGYFVDLTPPEGLDNVVSIAAGPSHALALKADGTVVAWGWNENGQTDVPDDLSNVIGIAAGHHHSMALLSDGTVEAWGAGLADDPDVFPHYDQSNVPPELDGGRVVEITAGSSHSLALMEDGSVVAWGSNHAGQTDVPGDETFMVESPVALEMILSTEHGTLTFADTTGLTFTDGGNGEASMQFQGLLGDVNAALTTLSYLGDLNYNGRDTITITAGDIWVEGQWRVDGHLPDGLTGYGVAALADGILIYGGKTASSTTLTTETLLYRPGGSVDLSPGDMPEPLTVMGATVAGGKAWAIGGYTEGAGVAGRRNDVWRYDPNTESWSATDDLPKLSGHRGRLRSATIGDYIYAVGGHSESPRQDLSIVERYNWREGGQWERMADMVTPRSEFALVSTGGKLYAIGGVNTATRLDTMEVYDPQTNTWELMPGQMPSGRTWIATAVLDDRIYVMGAESPPTGLLNEVIYFDLSAQQWHTDTSTIPQLPTTLYAAESVVVNETIYLVGGAVAYGQISDNVYAMTLQPPESTSAEIPVTINPVNDAPKLTVPESLTADEDASEGVLPAIKVEDVDMISGNGFIAGGGGHSVGLRVDGTVAVWGAGSWGDGEHTPPPGLSDVVAVSANSEHSLALKSDGTVVAWGTSDFGLDTVPCDLGAVEAISAGYEYNLVLETDGDVIAWGRNQYGERDVPPDLGDVKAIAAGYTFGMALESDGSVITWGEPDYAYGEFVDLTPPEELDNAEVVSIAAGGSHALALKADGTVVAWGWNEDGQTDVPAELSNVVGIAAGHSHSLALLSDGTVVAWGAGSSEDPAGYPNYGQATVPAGLTDVIEISVGSSHSLALKEDGSIVAWGRNHAGQTDVPADGTFMVDSPVALEMTLSAEHGALTLADTTGLTFTDGANGTASMTFEGLLDAVNAALTTLSYQGVLNYNGPDTITVTADDGALSPREATTVANGYFHTVGVREDGTVVAWGDDTHGKLDVSGLTDVVAVGASQYHTLVLKSDGTLAGVGSSTYYAFDGVEDLSTVEELQNVKAFDVSPSNGHNLALIEDGTVVAWGDPDDPNDPNDKTKAPPCLANTKVTAVAAGGGHSLALTEAGAVVGWGQDSEGQRDAPPELDGKVVKAISAGGIHSIALKADGTVEAWGNNNWRQLEIPEDLCDVVAISAGGYHNMALLADGSVRVWGRDDMGQLEVPYDLDDVVAIVAGMWNCTAIQADGTIRQWGRPDEGQSTPPPGETFRLPIERRDTETIPVTVNPVNDAPQITSLSVTPNTIDEGQTVTLTAEFTDPDIDDTHWYSINWGDGSVQPMVIPELPPDARSFSATHKYLDDDPSGTPSGEYTITVVVSDYDLSSVPADTAVTVNNVAPSFEAGPDEILLPPVAGVFNRPGISFTDPGQDVWSGTVNFGDGTGDQPLVIDQVDKTFDLSHIFTVDGPYTVTVTVNDDDVGAHVDSFKVEVYLNTPPVAQDDEVSTDEDTWVLIDVLADNGYGPDSDAEGNIDPARTINLTSPLLGRLTNHLDGTFTYNPNGDFEWLAVGESQNVSFNYQIEDTFGETDAATVTVTITGANDGPTIAVDDDPVSVNEGDTASNTGTFTDVDLSDNVTISSSIGAVEQDPGNDGAWSWLFATTDGPDESQQVTITADDGNGGTAATTFDLIVNNVDPTLDDVTFEIAENRPNGTVVGAVIATDPGADTLIYSIVGGTGAAAFAIDPNTGEITVADEAKLDFEANPKLILDVEVRDDDGGRDPATVTINLLNQASITGVVFVDVNQNNVYDANEPGINGVTVDLLEESGGPVLDFQGNPITATTADGGMYLFEDLEPGTYQVHELQPTGVDDGAESLGSLGGVVVANDVMQLTLERTDAFDYDFAELGQQVTSGDTATIGFWQNKHGQALIAQGGAELAAWLTANFGNIFGDEFAGANGGDVARFYKEQLFRQKSKKSAGPAKVDAQFMAVAFATYFTSNTLAGTVAADYGFNVTDTGIATRLVNVGNCGAAFGVDDGIDLTVGQLLQATNVLTDLPDNLNGFAYIYDRDGDGEIDSTEAWLRSLANVIYTAINEQGDIQ